MSLKIRGAGTANLLGSTAAWAERIFQIRNVPLACSADILFVPPAEMHRLALTHKQLDRPTDVLSFVDPLRDQLPLLLLGGGEVEARDLPRTFLRSSGVDDSDQMKRSKQFTPGDPMNSIHSQTTKHSIQPLSSNDYPRWKEQVRDELREEGLFLAKLVSTKSVVFSSTGGNGSEVEMSRKHILDLGQLIICPDYMLSKRRRFGPSEVMPFEPYLSCVLVHGLLHLLGHNHDEEFPYYWMRKEEQWTMRRLWNDRKRGRLPQLRI